MNATVLATSVKRIIGQFGNSAVYHTPILTDGTTYFNTEGDWERVYETTTVGFTWVEPNSSRKLEFTELGGYVVKENSAIVPYDVNLGIRGKVVSNTINWEIVKIDPIRIKDTIVAYSVEANNIVD